MAGRIPQSFIDELLARIDIVDIIDARVPLKSAGRGEFKACCPFHEEKTPSFTVSSDKQFYHCFGCSEHGTVIGFLMNYAHLSFVEAIEELAAHAGVDIPYERQNFTKTSADQHASDSQTLLDLLNQANQCFKRQIRDGSPCAKQAIDYLKQRGLSGETARDFEIGLAADNWDTLVVALGKNETTLVKMRQAGLVAEREQGGYYDRFRMRIIFPIHDFKGRVVGFGGRVLGQGEPKYLNSPETPVFHKGSELYNLHRCRGEIKQAGFALVVEGYMDVIVLSQFGIKNAVATLGTATTRFHLDRLFRYTDDIIFCFDGDKAGERAAWRALETVLPVITAGRQVKFLFLPQGHDPDSLVKEKGKRGFDAMLAKAVPLSEFLLIKLEKQTDLSHLEGRARLLSLARPYLNQLGQGPLKQLLLEQLARMAQTEIGTTQAQIIQSAAHPPRQPAARGKKPAQDDHLAYSPVIARSISLLIQHPQLNQAHSQAIKALTGIRINGVDVLIELSDLLDRHQALSTAALVERFRESASHGALEKLAAQHHLIEDEAQLGKEFEEILGALNRQKLDQSRKALMEKVKNGQITEEMAANQLKALHIQRFKSSDI